MENHRNKRECKGCHKEIPRAKKKCPFCGGYRDVYCAQRRSPFLKRNKEIVRMLKDGESTLGQVGERYNITRERVRQLYRVTAKKPYTTLLEKRRRVQRKIKTKEEEMQKNKIQFYCRDCNKPVLFSEIHSHQQIICRDCYQIYKKELRNWRVTKLCKQCGKQFHPYANNTSQFLCSTECYTLYGRGQGSTVSTISSVFRINNRVIQSYA